MNAAAMPALSGASMALLAAALFGASTPLVQRFGAGLGPLTTAALLYAGAAFVGAMSQRPVEQEAAIRRADLPRLVVVAALGAVVGPVALAWGLQHTGATAASLLLMLEVVFTAIAARALYREHIGGRVVAALVLLAAGGALLVVADARSGSASVAGLLAVLLATVAWGVDNSVSRALAERDPSQVVMAKSVLGVGATTLLALLFGETMPSAVAALGLLAVGATGYGLSLRCYLLAQRAFGATRTGSVFAFAPFLGAGLAYALGDRALNAFTVIGGACMLTGLFLHLFERHSHAHAHEAMEHEHAHRHDDDHHDHVHVPMPAGMHSHWHAHEARPHAHPHVPDAHHTHAH